MGVLSKYNNINIINNIIIKYTCIKIKLGIKCLIAGGLTGLIAIGTSALLDNYMKSTLSNFIGLLIAMCFNFIWQQFIFVGKIKTIGGLLYLNIY